MRIALLWTALMVVLIVAKDLRSEAVEPGKPHYTIVGIVVGNDTLTSVQEKLGPSKRCVVSEHLTTIGYAVANETVLFEAGDIGAGDITGFVLRTPQSKPACSLASPRIKVARLATDGGIHLGMTKVAFTKLFGRPQKTTSKGTWVYQWMRTQKLTEAEQQVLRQSSSGLSDADTMDILTTVEARFSSEELAYFYISRIKAL
jgi:hypothetical protein